MKLKIIKFSCFVLCLFLLQACGLKKMIPFVSSKNQVTSPDERVVSKPIYDLGEREVINAQAFVEGGGLLVIPFTPGESIEVTQKLDRSALMIVKGVAEGIPDNSPYTFLMTDEADLSDVIMEGKIDTFRVQSWWRKLFFQKRKAYLAVTLTMRDRYSDEVISSMSFDKESMYTKNVFDKLAYEIGQDIALQLMVNKGEFQ